MSRTSRFAHSLASELPFSTGAFGRSTPSTFFFFGPRALASRSFLESPSLLFSAIALAACPTCLSISIITAMPFCTSSLREARTIPTMPIGSAESACWSTLPASSTIASTSGCVTARTVSRIFTTASPNSRTSSGP